MCVLFQENYACNLSFDIKKNEQLHSVQMAVLIVLRVLVWKNGLNCLRKKLDWDFLAVSDIRHLPEASICYVLVGWDLFSIR